MGAYSWILSVSQRLMGKGLVSSLGLFQAVETLAGDVSREVIVPLSVPLEDNGTPVSFLLALAVFFHFPPSSPSSQPTAD